MIFILEPNGQTNTSKYVKNTLPPNCKVFTSRGSSYSKDVGIPVFRNYRNSVGLKKLYYYLVGWLRIALLLQKDDVFHFHWLKFSPLDYVFISVLKLRKVLLVGTVHNILPHEKKIYDRFFFERIYRSTDELIFHTEGILKNFSNGFFLPKSYHIINHYYDPVKIESDKEVAHKLLFFGNIRRYKGLELLLESIKSLKTDLQWELCIAGNPEYDISDLIEETKSLRNIQWKTSYIDNRELEELFNQSGIVVMPYLKIDTSGLLYLAKSYGKVIIAPKMGVFEESIIHRKNGLLFSPGDAESLADVIALALDTKVFQQIKGTVISELPENPIDEFRNAHQKLYSNFHDHIH